MSSTKVENQVSKKYIFDDKSSRVFFYSKGSGIWLGALKTNHQDHDVDLELMHRLRFIVIETRAHKNVRKIKII